MVGELRGAADYSIVAVARRAVSANIAPGCLIRDPDDVNIHSNARCRFVHGWG